MIPRHRRLGLVGTPSGLLTAAGSVRYLIPHWTSTAPRSSGQFGDEANFVTVRVSELENLDNPIETLQLTHVVTKVGQALALCPGVRNADIDRDATVASLSGAVCELEPEGPHVELHQALYWLEIGVTQVEDPLIPPGRALEIANRKTNSDTRGSHGPTLVTATLPRKGSGFAAVTAVPKADRLSDAQEAGADSATTLRSAEIH